MITKYNIQIMLEFENQTNRDNVYTKLKTALASAKVSDAWSYGVVSKDEYSKSEKSQESV